MKHFAIGALAAIALACVSGAAVAANADDATRYEIDRSVVYEGAQLVAPSLEPSRIEEIERAYLTAYEADQSVSVPWGDWLGEIAKFLGLLAGAAALWVLRQLPATLVSAIDAFAGMMGQGRASELIEKAIGYGINVTAGAARGKTLDFKVGNEVLERAFEYAIRHAPTVVAKAGGLVQLREKIIARLDLAPDVALPSAHPPTDAALVSATPGA